MIKHSVRLVGTLAVIIAISMAAGVRRAAAGGSTTATGNFTESIQFCNYSVTFTSSPIDVYLTIDNGDAYLILRDSNGNVVASSDDDGGGLNSELKNVPVTTDVPYIIEATTYDYAEPANDGTHIGPFALTLYSPFSSFSLISCGPGVNNAVTWFNPGDNRIDGQPGDRVVVWCNKNPDEIVVYGVGDASNGSKGFLLGVFSNADLLKAGGTGITKDAGLGNGTISAMQDGKGDFYVAWNGGNFNATGVGIFSKTFSCFQ